MENNPEIKELKVEKEKQLLNEENQRIREKSQDTSEKNKSNKRIHVIKTSSSAGTSSSGCNCSVRSNSAEFYPQNPKRRKRALSHNNAYGGKKDKLEKKQKSCDNKRQRLENKIEKKYMRQRNSDLRRRMVKCGRKNESTFFDKSDDGYDSADGHKNDDKGKSNDRAYNEDYNKRLDCLAKFGKNFYCPALKRMKGLRPIYIDGSNVAYSHGQNERFSVKGLKICIDYFRKRGHEVKAFVPHFRLKKGESTDHQLLHKLVNKKLVITTPTLYIQNQRRSPYDDWYIIQSAAANGGIIISADNFQDIIKWNPNLRSVIEECRLVPTFVDDMLIFPVDPHGNRRNNLEQFLRF